MNATFHIEGKVNPEDKLIGPTIISDLEEDSLLMKEEIFGPILPIKTYNSTEEVLNYLSKKDKPLALYVYALSNRVIKQIIKNTRAGTTALMQMDYNSLITIYRWR